MRYMRCKREMEIKCKGVQCTTNNNNNNNNIVIIHNKKIIK